MERINTVPLTSADDSANSTYLSSDVKVLQCIKKEPPDGLQCATDSCFEVDPGTFYDVKCKIEEGLEDYFEHEVILSCHSSSSETESAEEYKEDIKESHLADHCYAQCFEPVEMSDEEERSPSLCEDLKLDDVDKFEVVPDFLQQPICSWTPVVSDIRATEEVTDADYDAESDSEKPTDDSESDYDPEDQDNLLSEDDNEAENVWKKQKLAHDAENDSEKPTDDSDSDYNPDDPDNLLSEDDNEAENVRKKQKIAHASTVDFSRNVVDHEHTQTAQASTSHNSAVYRRNDYAHVKPRKCPFCGEWKKEKFFEHLRKKHNAKINDGCSGKFNCRQCPFCGKWYRRVFQHVKIRHRDNARTIISDESVIAQAYGLYDPDLYSSNDVREKFEKHVLEKMRDDDIGMLCKTDWVIKFVGWKRYAQLNLDDYGAPVRNKLKLLKNEIRFLAKLCMKFMSVLKSWRNISETANTTSFPEFRNELSVIDMFNSRNFNAFKDAFRRSTTDIGHDGQVSNLPAVQQTMYYFMMRAATVLRVHFLQQKDIVKATDLTEFQKLLQCNRQIGGIFMNKRRNKRVSPANPGSPGKWPLKRREREGRDKRVVCKQRRKSRREQDVMKLRRHTISRMRSILEDPALHWTSLEFAELRDLCCSHLTLLNAGRGGIPAELPLSAWAEACNSADSDTARTNGLSDADKEIYHDGVVVPQSRKDGVILIVVPANMVAAIRKLADPDVRHVSDVHEENLYLFPNVSQSEGHVSGFEAMKTTCEKAGVVTCVSATKLRYRIAMYASLDLPLSRSHGFNDSTEHLQPVDGKDLQALLPPAGEENTYLCYLCGKKLRSEQTFHRHMMAVHSDERPYTCADCGHRSAFLAPLKKHIWAKHIAGRKPAERKRSYRRQSAVN